MSTTKPRQPVPRVPPMSSKSRNTAHLPGEFPFTELPKTHPSRKPENSHTKEKTMSTASKLKAMYDANKTTIKRKAIVAVGATAGMLITGAISTHIRRQKIIILTDASFDDVIVSDMVTDFDTLSDTVID